MHNSNDLHANYWEDPKFKLEMLFLRMADPPRTQDAFT